MVLIVRLIERIEHCRTQLGGRLRFENMLGVQAKGSLVRTELQRGRHICPPYLVSLEIYRKEKNGLAQGSISSRYGTTYGDGPTAVRPLSKLGPRFHLRKKSPTGAGRICRNLNV
jgi:hypothetical protein